MQAALRLARHRAPPLRAVQVRRLATTTTANVAGSTSSSSATSTSTSSSAKLAPIPLSNVEAQWENFSSEEKSSVQEQLEELQKRDWKTLSIDEKKAAYYVAFGPHGPRTPVNKPGEGVKIVVWTLALVAAAGGLFIAARNLSQPPPKTMTKEWEEETNKRALEMNLNPITGISSEGYKGKGFVQSSK